MAGRVVRQERAVRTRAKLVQSAAEVFAESGYAGAAVSDIVGRAGLTLGALYFHFRSKGDLAREIVLSQPDLVVPAQSSEGLQHAVDVTLTWAYHLLDNPVLRAGARLVMEQEFFVAPGENSHQQWTRVVTEDLQEARRRGELREETDVGALARLVVNACTGAQMHSQIETGRRDLPRRVEEMWRCLLGAIAAVGVAETLDFTESRARLR
ncbi:MULTISPECIES: ScbR family autoregulator-binding transcription factor [Streptomyces]|uniref:ScbR family autoregulator-binding transcription factor n=1 Tax=Streptomyces evansiae TaxID=3075535 RepID=A0ABU2R0F9_9ACTN|nr:MULTISPECIES: ScbR family autoregulator-binding transcription factor [unclassified Streptomyces]MDT0409579.1 ScbR family autoregulator-binding transcription factor [Streptomyces sp. DSM 41979]MYQ57027.1 TetR family transcriptional regulator [Streptomyces sp. SID4926]SCE53766.1 transcriptional regulator, TetR family [Streptomyces sp. DfronAA-171]